MVLHVLVARDGDLIRRGRHVASPPERIGNPALDLLVARGTDHEVRITVGPDVHTPAGITELVQQLERSGARRIVLQEVRATSSLTDPWRHPSAQPMRDLLADPPPGVHVRGAAASRVRVAAL